MIASLASPRNPAYRAGHYPSSIASDDAFERSLPAAALFVDGAEGDLKTKTPQDDRIAALADPLAEGLGLEVVRVRVMSGKRQRLQIMIDRLDATGVDVDDCARLSRALSDVFEVEDPVSGEYDLEISSPGIDRPLTALAHFARWEGYEARIELDRLVEGRKRFKGVLAGVEDGNVLLNMEGEDETALIPFDWIAEAKLVLTDALIEADLKARGGKPPAQTEGDE
jgi:ribosome maturation factor RimP